jgi:preprotein translocase subunit Sec61beta
MAKNNKVGLPSSGAGITRYFDEFKSKIQIKPISVVIILIFLALLILFLHQFGYSFLGINGA